jgi:hypothetical protein
MNYSKVDKYIKILKWRSKNMKYSYVFEDKNNDELQELRKLGEK